MAANFTGSITDSSHHISPDTRRYMRQGWINVEPMSQPVGQPNLVEKLMIIQYLNHPPYPNRWMITLIQQGSVCDLKSSEPGCQEDGSMDQGILFPENTGNPAEPLDYWIFGLTSLRTIEPADYFQNIDMYIYFFQTKHRDAFCHSITLSEYLYYHCSYLYSPFPTCKVDTSWRGIHPFRRNIYVTFFLAPLGSLLLY